MSRTIFGKLFAFKDTILALQLTSYFLWNIFRLWGPNASTQITAAYFTDKTQAQECVVLYIVMFPKIESTGNNKKYKKSNYNTAAQCS